MPRPSQNFLIVTIETSRRDSSNILYAVEGVTPDKVANSLIFIPRLVHKSLNLFATASLTPISITSKTFYGFTRVRVYALAYI